MQHVINNSEQPTVSYFHESIQKVKKRKNSSYQRPEPISSDQHMEDNYKKICIHKRNKRGVRFVRSSRLVWDGAQLQGRKQKKKINYFSRSC